METKSLVRLLEDSRCYQVNREKMCSDHKYFSSLENAKKDDRKDYIQSLDGKWYFNFSNHLDGRIKNFHELKSEYKSWDLIDVPSHIELNGYDRPQYVNTMYPWDGRNEITPPYIPQDYNPTGQYVRTFELSDELTSGDYFICFEGVETAFNLWVNGQYVGYSEDSYTPSHFNITNFLCEGINKIAVETYKYCSGTWLEDQDFWRLSGIMRPVYIFVKPVVHCNDLKIVANLDDDYIDGILDISASINVKSLRESIIDKDKIRLEYELEDKNHSKVEMMMKEGISKIDGNQVSINHQFDIKAPFQWSAEMPDLYNLLIKVKYEDKIVEVIKQRIGFRRFEIKDGLLLINGKRIVFKGVNRHDFSHINGRSVTPEEMIWDFEFMKNNNINASRCAHYPNQSLVYDLADEYGIYLIDEANIETHGTWQIAMDAKERPQTIPNGKDEWKDAILARGEAMYQRDKNHPSILMWSCGNESFGGENLYLLSEYFRKNDPSRVVHYESIFWDRRYNDTSDVESRMYAFPEAIEKYIENDGSKPFILCEYSHAMGNSNGGLNEYKALEKYPSYQGGFIWDYIDQSILTKNHRGEEFLAYGGDFDDRPTDYNFCVNGLIYGDRKPSPKMEEIKYQFQNIRCDVKENSMVITNEFLFTSTGNFEFHLYLLENGKKVENKICEWDVMPLTTKEFHFTFDYKVEPTKNEYVIGVDVKTKEDSGCVKKGHVIAQDQFVFGTLNQLACLDQRDDCDAESIDINDGDINIGAKGKDFEVIFNKFKGHMISLKYDGKEMMKAPLMPQFWLAPTDNDKGFGFDLKSAQWKIASQYQKLKDYKIEKYKDFLKIKFDFELLNSDGTGLKIEYKVLKNGQIDVSMTLDDISLYDTLAQFGMLIKVPYELNHCEYYGKGVMENYNDRNNGAMLGIHSYKVDDNLSKYVIPQECGNRTDNRWIKVIDKYQNGIKISSTKTFEASVLHYSPYELDNAQHIYELPNANYTNIIIASKKKGVGGDDSWGATPRKQSFLTKEDTKDFAFTISKA